MADVWTENRQDRLKVSLRHLRWFANRILEALSLERTSVSILVTDDDGIQELNRRYLHRDRPTNVISFPMQEGEIIRGDTAYLGDLVISADAAVREGAAQGYRPEELLLLYVIHGLLHLAGYDHEGDDPTASKRMEAKQNALLEFLLPFLAEHPIGGGMTEEEGDGRRLICKKGLVEKERSGG